MGGQIVGIKDNIMNNVIIKESKEGLLIEGIKLDLSETAWTIVTVCNNCGFDNLEKELENVISVAEEKNQSIIVIGDMNARIEEEQVKLGDGDASINEIASKYLIRNAEGKRCWICATERDY